MGYCLNDFPFKDNLLENVKIGIVWLIGRCIATPHTGFQLR